MQHGGSRISVLVLGCKFRSGYHEVWGNLKRLDTSRARLEGQLESLCQEMNQALSVGFAEPTPDLISKRELWARTMLFKFTYYSPFVIKRNYVHIMLKRG